MCRTVVAAGNSDQLTVASQRLAARLRRPSGHRNILLPLKKGEYLEIYETLAGPEYVMRGNLEATRTPGRDNVLTVRWRLNRCFNGDGYAVG